MDISISSELSGTYISSFTLYSLDRNLSNLVTDDIHPRYHFVATAGVVVFLEAPGFGRANDLLGVGLNVHEVKMGPSVSVTGCT